VTVLVMVPCEREKSRAVWRSPKMAKRMLGSKELRWR
jgi:hypothetical protein